MQSKDAIPVLSNKDGTVIAYVDSAKVTDGDFEGTKATVLDEEAFALYDRKEDLLGLVRVQQDEQLIVTVTGYSNIFMSLPEPFKDLTAHEQIKLLTGFAADCARILVEKKGLSSRGLLNSLALSKYGRHAEYALASAQQLNNLTLNKENSFTARLFTRKELEKQRLWLSRN